MSNALFSIQNGWLNLQQTAEYLLYNKIFLGFCLGFAISTLLHLLIIVGSTKDLAHLLTKDAHHSYKVIVPSDPQHPEYKTFEQHRRLHKKTRVAIYSATSLLGLALLYFFLR